MNDLPSGIKLEEKWNEKNGLAIAAPARNAAMFAEITERIKKNV